MPQGVGYPPPVPPPEPLDGPGPGAPLAPPQPLDLGSPFVVPPLPEAQPEPPVITGLYPPEVPDVVRRAGPPPVIHGGEQIEVQSIPPPPPPSPALAVPPPVEGPDVDIARARDRVRNLGDAKTAAELQAAELSDELRSVATQLAGEQDPKKQEALLKRAGAIQARLQGADVASQASDLALEREEAALNATVQAGISEARTAKLQEASEVLGARTSQTLARAAELREDQAAARDRVAERTQRYADILERGPRDTGATWTSAIGMIGEMWSAFAQRRQPNFQVWLDRGLQQAREAHKGQLDAERARIAGEEQVIADAATEIAQMRADDAAFESAYLTQVDRDLAALAAEYANTPRGQAAEMARQEVARRQEARAAEAQAAAEKAQRERRKFEADMRKADLEARLLERKLAPPAAGTGAGAAEFGRRTDIPEDALVDPITGVVLGQSRFPKKARDDQQTVNDFTTALRDIQTYALKLDEVGKIYSGPGEKAVRRQDVAELKQLYNDIFMKTQRALTGAAVTEQEAKRIAEIIPGPLTYTDLGTWDPADVIRTYRDRMATKYEDFLGSRLSTGTTLLRSPQGQTLPSSPTFAFKSEQGADPIRSVIGQVTADLNQAGETEWRTSMTRWLQQAATAPEAERARIVEGFERAAVALEDTKQAERAKIVREAIKNIGTVAEKVGTPAAAAALPSVVEAAAGSVPMVGE